MKSSLRRLAVTTAVYLGALFLFGPLTFVLLTRTIETVAGIVGIDTPFPGIVSVVVVVGAIAIALEVVSEIAAVQLHGVAALRRGSPRRQFGRNLLLATVAFVAGLAVIEFAFETLQWGIVRGQVVITGLSLVLVAGLAWIFVRAVRSYRLGRHRTE